MRGSADRATPHGDERGAAAWSRVRSERRGTDHRRRAQAGLRARRIEDLRLPIRTLRPVDSRIVEIPQRLTVAGAAAALARVVHRPRSTAFPFHPPTWTAGQAPAS